MAGQPGFIGSWDRRIDFAVKLTPTVSIETFLAEFFRKDKAVVLESGEFVLYDWSYNIKTPVSSTSERIRGVNSKKEYKRIVASGVL